MSDLLLVIFRDCHLFFCWKLSKCISFCTQDGEKQLDLDYFREMALEFYLSDNASDLGNFINGQLKYD